MTFAMYSNTNTNTFFSKKSTNTEYFMNTQKMYSNSIRIRIQNTITPGLQWTAFQKSKANKKLRSEHRIKQFKTFVKGNSIENLMRFFTFQNV